MLKNFTVLAITLACCLLMANILVSFLPVNQSLMILPVNHKQPVFKALPNRDIQFSKEWDFKYANKKHINNHGFVNPHDYVYHDKKPLVAVVGDSYVETLHIPDDKTFFERLAKLQPALRFYSFGFSGAPLSEYLAWAEHAAKIYDAKYLLITVVGNDFDESLVKYGKKHGFFQYDFDGTGALKLNLNDLDYTFLTWNLRKVPLVEYLCSNLQILHLKDNLLQHFQRKITYVGNAINYEDNTVINDSYKVIDAFFRDLPKLTHIKPDHILLVIDGLRYEIYQNKPETLTQGEQTYFGKMRRYFIDQGRALGFHVLDTQQAFSQDYAKAHTRFEFKTDGHWNPYAHGVVADAITHTEWWQDLRVSTSFFGKNRKKKY